MNKMMIKEHRKLTEISINIFGDMVNKCFISTSCYVNSIENSTFVELDNVLITCDDNESSVTYEDDNESSVTYEDETIYVLFKNGNLVEFSTTECARFGLIDINTLTLLNGEDDGR